MQYRRFYGLEGFGIGLLILFLLFPSFFLVLLAMFLGLIFLIGFFIFLKLRTIQSFSGQPHRQFFRWNMREGSPFKKKQSQDSTDYRTHNFSSKNSDSNPFRSSFNQRKNSFSKVKKVVSTRDYEIH